VLLIRVCKAKRREILFFMATCFCQRLYQPGRRDNKIALVAPETIAHYTGPVLRDSGTWKRFAGRVRGYGRRHWQTALKLRDRLRISEEAFHLVIASGVGLVAG